MALIDQRKYWLVPSKHLYNLNNLDLGIGADGLRQITDPLSPRDAALPVS